MIVLAEVREFIPNLFTLFGPVGGLLVIGELFLILRVWTAMNFLRSKKERCKQ